MNLPWRRTVVLYSTADCHLCHDARAKLVRWQRRLGFVFREVDIMTNRKLATQYALAVPVVVVDGHEALISQVTDFRLLRALVT